TGALTRAFAAYAFCRVTGKTDPGMPELIELLHAPDVTARELAVGQIGRLGKIATNALPELEKALRDSDSGVRIAAARSVWKISGSASTSIPVLRLLLTIAN